MKYFGVVIVLLFIASSVSAQEILWLAEKKSDNSQTLIDTVSKKVLQLYDDYEYYYEERNYTKEGFIESFNGSRSGKQNSRGWERLKEKIKVADELTVFAVKEMIGKKNVIFIISVSRGYVNLLEFSNIYEPESILTYPSDRKDFMKLFVIDYLN